MVPVSELIRSLIDHLDGADFDDPQRILDERALAVAEELRGRRTTDPDEGLWICYLIAALHLDRAGALEESQRQEDSARAAGLFSVIGQLRPELVPSALLGLIKNADDSGLTPARLEDLRLNAIGCGDPAALNLAAAILRRIIEADPSRLEDLAALAEVLWARAERVRDIEDLEEAAAVNGAWLEAASESHPDRAFRLWRTGLAKVGRHMLSGERADLDAAITHFFNAYKRAADDDPKRRSYVSDLCLGLHRRAELTGLIEDYDLAVDAWELSLVMTPAEHPDHASGQFNLGTMLAGRFEAGGEAADLDAAIDARRLAAAHYPPGHPLHPTVLPVLADALQTRAARNGSQADADEAIRVFGSLIETSASEQETTRLLSGLGTALWIRHTITGDLGDLAKAIEAGRDVLAGTSPDDPRLPVRQSNLLEALVTRFELTSNHGDITEASVLARSSVAAMRSRGLQGGLVLSNAGNALRELSELLGDSEVLEEAIGLHREAISVFTETDHRYGAAVANLADSMRLLAEQTGDLEVADAAVALWKRAARHSSDGHAREAGVLNNLASALRVRFELSGSTADLEEGIRTGREALAGISSGHPSYGACTGVLGALLVTHHRRFGDSESLEKGVALIRESVAAAPPKGSPLDPRLSVLAAALITTYRHTGRSDDLEAAVSAARESLSALPESHPLRVVALHNLADILHRRFEAFADPENLDEAVTLIREALAETPLDAPIRTNELWVLGKAIDSMPDDPATRAEAIAAFVEASSIASAPASRRIRAGHIAARMILGDGDGDAAAALPLLRQAVNLLPRLAWRGLDRSDQQRLLDEDAAALAMDAAACAIALGDTPEAVRLLEQGRGVLWGQLLDLRSDRARLREARPRLAAELDRCLSVLDPARNGDGAMPARPDRALNEAAHRLDALVAEIRALPASDAFPNPSEFMAPPEPGSLLPSGSDAVVVLNMSRWRCDAILLTEDGSVSLRLPFTAVEAVEATDRYLDALRRHSGPTSGMALEAATRATLEWLWDHVAAPVLDHLGLGPESDEPPRIWWCPTGPLTLLPVHAAGDGTDSVLDRAVSSYTPTLRALAHARSQPPADAPTPLVVSIGQTPGQFADLPGADMEQQMLVELFGADAVTALKDESATRDAIVGGLGTNSWVHIASHGIQDLGRPSEGGLVPFDWETAGLIRVDDLAGIAGNGGGLAFLSACQTATGGGVNLDEAISVAAAMQHAGWSHVVGTLWTVYDDVATEVAQRFYRRIIRDGRPDFSLSAHALHEAVLELRDANPYNTAHWVRFVHFGP